MALLWGWKNGDFNGGFGLDFWGFGGWFFRGKVLEMKFFYFLYKKKKKNLIN